MPGEFVNSGGASRTTFFNWLNLSATWPEIYLAEIRSYLLEAWETPNAIADDFRPTIHRLF